MGEGLEGGIADSLVHGGFFFVDGAIWMGRYGWAGWAGLGRIGLARRRLAAGARKAYHIGEAAEAGGEDGGLPKLGLSWGRLLEGRSDCGRRRGGRVR